MVSLESLGARFAPEFSLKQAVERSKF